MRSFGRSGLLLGLAWGLAACGGPDGFGNAPLGEAEDAVKVCPKGEVVEGVDVSGYQPNTDWTKAKADGIDFAVVKATEGTGYVNPYFDQDWAGLKSNGMFRGPYHFFHPGGDPIAQADHFVSTFGALEPGDLPPVCDLEVTDGASKATIQANTAAFLERVEQKSGRVPMIYTSPYFWNTVVGAPAGFEKYHLWVAHWETDCPNTPEGWSDWPFWQYADNGSVNGIAGNVDLDRFNGSLAELAVFAKGKEPLAQVSGNEAISVVSWIKDDHAEVFVKSKAGKMLHTWSQGAADTWNPAADLDASAECGFAASFWAPPQSYAEVWAPLSSGATGHLWWADGAWNTFQDFGGKGMRHLSALAWNDAHDEIFALGPDDAIWSSFWDKGAGAWSAWASLGGKNFVTGASAILWGDGHAEIFATDADGTAWHAWTGADGWNDWAKIEGKVASRPVPVRWADGHVAVFARGVDGHLVVSDFADGWPAFTVVDDTTTIWGEPGAIMNGDAGGAVPGPEVFARTEAGDVVHLWWDGAGYAPFEALGAKKVASDPFGFVRGNGAAEVFAIDASGALVKSYHDPATGWSGWETLADADLDPCAEPPPEGGDGGGSAGDGGGGAGGGSGAALAEAADPALDDGGCSCRTATGAPTHPRALPWLAVGLAALVAVRRRRR